MAPRKLFAGKLYASNERLRVLASRNEKSVLLEEGRFEDLQGDLQVS